MWYHENLDALFSSLNSQKEGLSSAEASRRLAEKGRNELSETEKNSFLKRFFKGMCDRMTVVLLIAAAVSFITSYISGEGYADPIIILIIVIVNSLIAAIQESRAEKALEALKRLTSPEITVRRDGKTKRIPSAELVSGDVFLLEKGDIVPCDGRLLYSNELTVDESALTGESAGVYKDYKAIPKGGCPISEAYNSVFTSAPVISGRAEVLAVKTGMNTCVGEIAGMITTASEETPLQKRLAKLSALLGNVTLGICLVIFLFSVFRGMEIGEMFLTSVSLAVAAIPEGLPAIVTVVLSSGVQTMARRRAVVKRLPAVETLGCAQIICSDKTGTLTCNKMTVVSTYGNQADLALGCALCNNDSSPTEQALTAWAGDCEGVRANNPRIAEIPFDSVKKYMLTVNQTQSGFTVYLKGAPDVIMQYCRGKEAEIKEQTALMTENGLRVICFAKYECKVVPKEPLKGKFEFVGLCGIEDPPRPNAAKSIKICKRAGIRTLMITGDHPDTALSIAKKLGITDKNGMVLTERDTLNMNPEEFSKALEKCNVFARVTPSFKLKIVSALKSKGYVVAMTGDGVNDAPALKKADIGCAMGISGTEVAKESADMILTDDDFSTVVTAVGEGRGIYENLRRAIHFLLSCNIGELFTVFFSIILSLPAPLSAIQLLWVNLTTDSLPAIALGMEKTADDLMEKPPIKANSPLFSSIRSLRIIFEGLLIGTLSVSAFVIGIKRGDFLVGRTMCFLVLGMSQLFHSFNLRSDESVFSRKKKSNGFLWLAAIICFALQSAVVLIPAAANLFGVASLGLAEWLIAVGLSACPLAVCEVYKKLKH